MRLLSFSEAGRLRPEALIDEAVVDIETLVRQGGHPDHIAHSSVKELVATASTAELQQLDAAARQSVEELGVAIDRVASGPPIPNAQKVISAGFNHDANIAEGRAHKIDVGNGGPVVSTKLPTSLVGQLAPIELPADAAFDPSPDRIHSTAVALVPGDIVATGTPGGIGAACDSDASAGRRDRQRFNLRDRHAHQLGAHRTVVMPMSCGRAN